MTYFKDSKGMVEKTGVGMGLMGVASAKTILQVTEGAGHATGAMLGGVYNEFNKDAALAYGVPAYVILGLLIWGLWDVMFGHATLSDQRMAIFTVALFCVNALHAIASNAARLGNGSKELVKGYAPAWFGCTLLVFGGFYAAWLFKDVSITNYSPESILIGGFILFNLFPKAAYYMMRESRAEAVMKTLGAEIFGISLDSDNPDHRKRMETAWTNYKKAVGMKPLWMPTKIQFITIPLMVAMFVNG